ncbi:MAG TPA: bifunctional adenosylcobinamide kinase/adenosylcobinamide-phosphate guanylyltransferase [Bacillota bacterium]|nr:bifunctional adenosylcobinamide kinase/adenosylcobinamide-phosphate guanylyltransferase [Bacillota bacterium]
MHLIFGGAYQGKLDYAKERYGLGDGDIFSCDGPSIDDTGTDGPSIDRLAIDFKKKAVYRLEEFVLCCMRCGKEAGDYLRENRAEWEDTVFICTDISSGVVPLDKELRAWREMTGRTLTYLGKEAKEVTRVFCGLPQRIK